MSYLFSTLQIYNNDKSWQEYINYGKNTNGILMMEVIGRRRSGNVSRFYVVIICSLVNLDPLCVIITFVRRFKLSSWSLIKFYFVFFWILSVQRTIPLQCSIKIIHIIINSTLKTSACMTYALTSNIFL